MNIKQYADSPSKLTANERDELSRLMSVMYPTPKQWDRIAVLKRKINA